MPQNRLRIPADVERQVLIEAGHRCAVCGAEIPLERAHIIAWRKSQDHSAGNLICLCANCHGRADAEGWGEKTLRQYKQRPWVIRARSGPKTARDLFTTLRQEVPSAVTEVTGDDKLAQEPAPQRNIQIGHDANGNVLLTGDRNVVWVVQAGRTLEPEEQSSAPATGFGPNPYRGLAAFREEDGDRFFGRERLTENLWTALRDLQESRETEASLRLLSVLGPSGSGKSSLVRAGLLPELARRPLTGLENLRVAILAPGAHPVEALALVLARLATGDSSPVAKAREFSGELERRNQDGELDGLRRIAGDSPLLVFVDQFEEIYTLASATEREVFIGNLLHAAADRGGVVSVALTLRTDFLAQSQENERLHEIIARQSLIVPFLSEDGLRRAIAEPARCAGHPLDEGTIELLVRETRGREGALPVLQFTLSRIWEGLAGGVPAAQTYKDLGGVGGSLAKEAQRILESLEEPDRLIARRAFLRMVRVGRDIRDTARKVDLDEIVANGERREHVKAVLERFARPEARIITLAAEPEGTITGRLTHEALLERWNQIDQWLTPQAREDLFFHYRLEEQARYWDRKGRADELLWPKRDLDRLRSYEQHSAADMTVLQSDFFKLSNKLGATPRLKLLGFALSVVAMIVLFALLMETYRARIELSSPIADPFVPLTASSSRSFTEVEFKPQNDMRNLQLDLYLPYIEGGLLIDPGYHVLLIGPGSQEEVWKQELRFLTGAEPRFSVLIPWALLKPGRYELKLFGSSEGHDLLLESYRFRVIPP
jgi:HNH endonuclease